MFDLEQRLVELAPGVAVEQDVLGIVAKLRQYDPNLIVQYLDPDSHSNLTDAPYRIMEHCSDGHLRLVMQVWQLDDRVMERVFAADNERLNVLRALEDHNAKIKLDETRRYREEMEEAKDIVSSVIKSPKGDYSFKTSDETGEKIITVSDSVPAKVKRL